MVGTDSSPDRRRTLLASLVVVLLPVLAVFARYRGHSAHAFDPETSLALTAAREFVHGRLRFLPHYQLNLHQGSQILDAFLAVPGIWLFGDHTMAWGFVGLLWVAVTVAAGADLLRQLVGWSAVWVWSALLACAPFLIKDGLMALSGGHPQGAAMILLALTLALRARAARDRRSWWLAFAAGAVVGLGTWTTRSVVVAGPAVLLALWPPPGQGTLVHELLRGLRSPRIRAGAAGMALFAVSLAATFVLHKAADTRGAQDDHFVQRLLNPVVEMEACSRLEIESGMCEESESTGARLLLKTAELGGLKHLRALWLQPRSLTTGGPVEEWHRVRDLSGVVWVLGMIGGIPLLGWGLARGRASRPSWLLLVVCGTYLALYLGTSMRAEDLPESFWPEASEPPTPTNVRYLLPPWLLLLAVLAAGAGAGLRARGALRWCSAGLLGVLLVSGAVLSARDVVAEADPPGTFGRHLAFRYFLNYVDGRGPPRQAHEVCGDEDPISRANHLRSWASFNYCDIPCLMHDLTEADDELRWLVAQAGEACGQPLSAADRAFVAHGLGLWFGAQSVVMENDDIGVTVLRAFGAGDSLDETDARWFFEGVLDALWDYGEPMELDAAVELFCRETRWGTRPLCAFIGLRLCDRESPDPPTKPTDLCPGSEAVFASLPADIRVEAARGAGRARGHHFGGLARDGHDWRAWSREMEEAYLDGVGSGGRWRWRSEPMEYLPNRVP